MLMALEMGRPEILGLPILRIYLLLKGLVMPFGRPGILGLGIVSQFVRCISLRGIYCF